jgi:hypothetical protein
MFEINIIMNLKRLGSPAIFGGSPLEEAHLLPLPAASGAIALGEAPDRELGPVARKDAHEQTASPTGLRALDRLDFAHERFSIRRVGAPLIP